MRVTNNMLTRNLLKNLELANNRMDLIQNKLSSGKAITAPSDDPVKIGIALRYKSTISSMEQWKVNAGEALATLETTEGILANMTSMLQRLRELAVQGANGANSNDDRLQIVQEVKQLTEQFRVIANSQVGTKYIFGGSLVDIPPMPEPGVWNGNSKDLKIEVGSNLQMPISVDGRKLFQIVDDGDGTKSLFFDSLDNLLAGLETGDQTQINEALAEIDGHMDNVLGLRAELGARTNRMYVVSEQLDSSLINMKSNLSSIQDADLAATIMEFQSIQNVYRAALSVGSQIIQPSLVDFIK